MKNLMCEEAKQIDLVNYLASLGHQPQKVRNQDYWYLSSYGMKNAILQSNQAVKRLV